MELVSGAAWSSQSQPAEPENALEVGEQHLDLFALAARLPESLGARQGAGVVSGVLVDVAGDLAVAHVRAAPRLQRTRPAIRDTRPIAAGVVGQDSAGGAQRLAARAGVDVALGVVGEVAVREGAVGTLGLVPDRDVRGDLLRLEEAEELAGAVSGVGGQAPRLETEPLMRALQHGSGRGDFIVGACRRRLDVDDDRVRGVDQVIQAVAELHALVRLGRPGRAGIAGRDHLRRLALGRRLGVERGQVLPNGPALPGGVRPVELVQAGHPVVAAGVSLQDAGVHREALAAHQPGAHAALHRGLEHMAEDVALAEAAVPVLGKAGVVGHRVLQAEPAEPPVGQVQFNLLAQPALRADAEAVSHDQHPDHQLGVDRGPADRAVEGRERGVQIAEVQHPVDLAQQMTCRNPLLQAKCVEQFRLPARQSPHHRPCLRRSLLTNGITVAPRLGALFQQHRPEPDAGPCYGGVRDTLKSGQEGCIRKGPTTMAVQNATQSLLYATIRRSTKIVGVKKIWMRAPATKRFFTE